MKSQANERMYADSNLREAAVFPPCGIFFMSSYVCIQMCVCVCVCANERKYADSNLREIAVLPPCGT